jgi:hypothetical protein
LPIFPNDVCALGLVVVLTATASEAVATEELTLKILLVVHPTTETIYQL